MTLKNANETRLAQILGREVSDRITVVEAETQLNTDAYIERIDYAVDAGGYLMMAQLGFERADAVNYLIWGTGAWGTDLWGF